MGNFFARLVEVFTLPIEGSEGAALPQVIQDKRIGASISLCPSLSIAASDRRVGLTEKCGSLVGGSHCGTSSDQLNRAVLLDLEEKKAQLQILNERIQRRIEAEDERNSEEALEEELRQRELEIERERTTSNGDNIGSSTRGRVNTNSIRQTF